MPHRQLPYDDRCTAALFLQMTVPINVRHDRTKLGVCKQISRYIHRYPNIYTCDEISGVCAECSIPHPTLVTMQGFVKFEFVIRTNKPNLDSGVSRASGEIPSHQLDQKSTEHASNKSLLYVRAE